MDTNGNMSWMSDNVLDRGKLHTAEHRQVSRMRNGCTGFLRRVRRGDGSAGYHIAVRRQSVIRRMDHMLFNTFGVFHVESERRMETKMKFLETFFTVAVALGACCFAAFVACCIALRILMWPIIVVCLIILAYCAVT